MLAYVDNGLQPGTSYNYDAAAINKTGQGNKAVLSNVWTLPQASNYIRQVNTTTESGTINFNVPRGTKGFRILVDEQRTLETSSVLSEYTITEFVHLD
ncbi:hypothetical protein L2089_15480 [Paenibacillus hunanensis]|uniref:hypothetical protein n=1 Tax=Paenibacillus hunanensis TaxID=539262 RepID=UPI002025CE49|nr:hypothetical protein [Paenibacillus hunanensis]MCL9662095.1 hypothetical protein [Paenibacillus hunanensis]